MGYGEVGGDDSVQVSVHLKYPRAAETEEGAPPVVHGNADAKNQRSPRARAKATPSHPGRAYRGQDAQSTGPNDNNTDDAWNVFTVTIHFTRQSDLNAAKAAINAVTSLPADVEFPLKVVRYPGQVHVSWPDERPGSGV